MDQQKLLEDFYKTSTGRVLEGKESFRNRMGCIVHGLAHKHPKTMVAVGSLAFIGGMVGGPTMLLAVSPVMFAGVYTAITPKNVERAACEFLANVAVRKTDALACFLKKQNVNEADQKKLLQQYLQKNMPLGMMPEYMKKHPDAIEKITSGKLSEASYHSPEVYLLEAVQERLTKTKTKGGILYGMIQPFSAKYREQKQIAQEIAAKRWQNRQKWEKMPMPKPSWTHFMRSAEAPKKETNGNIVATFTHTRFNQMTQNTPHKKTSVETKQAVLSDEGR